MRSVPRYKILHLSGILALALCCASCSLDGVFKEKKDFANYIWHKDSTALFRFDIADTLKSYDIHLNVRHNLNYPYYNLYTNFELKNADGMIVRAAMQEVNLMHPQTGKPYGSAVSDVYQFEQPFLKGLSFKKAGRYSLGIRQYMRIDSLPGIGSVGINIQEAEND